MPSYPQVGHFAVDNMANNFAGETETASTLCMEAVILSGGEGERR